MNMLFRLHTIIVITATFLMYSQSYTMTLAVTCLKRAVGKQKNGIVFISDRHAFSNNSTIKPGHLHDMTKIIKIAAQKPYEVPFLVEISEAYTDSQRLKNVVSSPAQIAIQTALHYKMKLRNITFHSFDTRQERDFLLRDMLVQRNEFMQAIQENFEFPADFYTLSTGSILEFLGERHCANISLIKSLPATKETQAMYFAINKRLYEVSRDCLLNLLKVHNVSQDKDHIFNLIGKLNSDEVTYLGLTLLNENCFGVDINILQKTLNLSEKHPLCIISGGAFHCHNTEKSMLSDFTGFEKDRASSLSYQGLKLDSVFDIENPNPMDVPDHFMTKDLEDFLTHL